jgi:predicted DNA-binding transcriptional regulator AlpA
MNRNLEFLKDTEIAKALKISRQTVWRWAKIGKIPKPIKLGVKVTRWKASELYAWIEDVI